MNDTNHSTEQVTGWRRYADKLLLFSRKNALIIIAAWALCALLHKATYGPFYESFEPDGLAGNSVLSIYQDRDGNLWFGSWAGVSRYDGDSWYTFTTRDGLKDNHVTAIYQDEDGSLWFGTWEGVSRYDGASWQTQGDLGNEHVTAIVQSGDGDMWFGTFDGALRYDGDSWQSFTTQDGLGDDRVSSIIQDGEGNLWFGTWNGVSRYDGDSWYTFTTQDGLAGEHVESILLDDAGNLWCGTWDGLSRYDGTSWQTRDDLVNDDVLSMLQDRDGNLWFGTYEGLRRYDGAAWQSFRARVSVLPHALFILGTVVIPVYLLVCLAYTVVSTLDHAQYLALSRKTLRLIPAFILAVLLHGVLYALFYDHYSRVGGDEAVFFLVALLGVPLYFVVSLVYTVVGKVRGGVGIGD